MRIIHCKKEAGGHEYHKRLSREGKKLKEQFPYYSVEMEMLVNKLSFLCDAAEKLEHKGHMIGARKGMGAFLEGVAMK